MLATLKESTESRELVEAAKKYLRNIRGDLVQRKRNQEKRDRERLEKTMSLSAPPAAGLNGYTPAYSTTNL